MSSKSYSPTNIEDKWYKHWMAQGFFNSTPDEREPFTIVIPPPNVTGILHMGHMLNNTIQDVLIRRARLLGKNACWVPGTDHASIATEAKVVNMLKEKGIEKNDLSREEFLKYAWEWKEKHGGIILEQLKKLGASCDWDRTKFTMDNDLYDAVIEVFIDLFNKGLIYRGVRMVNWDPQAQTALSDEEVVHKEVQSKLYYISYQIKDSSESLTIATTRPETILGDTAICINPNDERYKHLKGKKVFVPLIEREIPIIFDDYVDMEFGTGCLKVTPAHDINDYNIGIRHNLEVIDVLNDDGTLSEKAQMYVGQDRFKVRKDVAKELDTKGYLSKVEKITNKVGFSERTDAVIEPKLSLQWFLKMENLSKPALDNVMNDTVQFHPSKFKNTYKHWMENVKDWCISRQLWWGQRIPVWYYAEGTQDYVVAKTAEQALELVIEKTGNQKIEVGDLRQDEDVLDTWFSSWLWPISVFDGFKNPDNPDINYYYPTNDLVTAPEIMFFWVARMIIAGYEYKGGKPFENVYYTGIVRDEKRRKMSKSLGNSPDPIKLMNKYGADGVRSGVLFSSPAGNDLLFDEKLCEQGRNFCNKIWNALKLIQGWQTSDNKQPEYSKVATDWMNAKINKAIDEIDDHFEKYRLSDALMTTYKLIWDDFCSWYLEMIKPNYGDPIDNKTLDETRSILETLMQMLHPFMPFITEEVWSLLGKRDKQDCVMVSSWPEQKNIDNLILERGEIYQDIVSNVRNIRNTNGISPKETLTLSIKTTNQEIFKQLEGLIKRTANLSSIEYINEVMSDCKTFLVKSHEFFIPIEIDEQEERKRLEDELKYNQGFLKSVQGKLKNERFVQNAPEAVVAKEKQKMEDAMSKIKALEESLANL